MTKTGNGTGGVDVVDVVNEHVQALNLKRRARKARLLAGTYLSCGDLHAAVEHATDAADLELKLAELGLAIAKRQQAAVYGMQGALPVSRYVCTSYP